MIYQNQPIGPLSNNSNDGSGGGGGEHVVDNNDSNMNGSYYNQTTPSSSFQNTYYQNSTQDLLTSQQGQRKRQQGAYYQHQQQHQYQQYQQQQPSSSARSLPLPAYSTSSLSSSLPVYSTSLQQYSQQQRYRQPTVLSQQQQQDQFYRSLAQSSTQQQRYHQESIPLPHPTSQSVLSTSSFPHEGPPRARSKSLTVVTSTAMKTNTNADTAAVPPSNSGSQSASLETASSHEGGTKKVYIPARPRMIPPRPPQTSAPRKYHGRQIRKLSAPSINHYQVSGMQELVPPARRMAHIQSEQKRREKINAGFEELKSVIPECAQNTDSKATILRKAVDRILELEDELRKYTGEFHYVPEDSKEREE
ncbi:hypothetical protein BCR41DRAFT_360511 [Lobosporangium transversale]|uniref:BHLH domain-containing protein n=1 Tax=Lobosporangium transversale TaxID=64571 RepID=A0A1Y2GCK5_9FUNG|nr:hypothetical protein BCR41DRAFT_360511 [Lobosporangium transversale]ORZ07029.1 hypothetical protein BCR41DRAFT_360511 [Lobosporangium transversale]|eukprot:XP_021877825.1 hypothetical protein BCR41DRAFT_360511 [Lobosporangium transversale]